MAVKTTTTKQQLSEGTVHKLPPDLKKALLASKEANKLWEDITPLARNEWICWTITVKQQKTRDEHVARVVEELKDGMRRPCCWTGCLHRKDIPLSPTKKWLISKQAKK